VRAYRRGLLVGRLVRRSVRAQRSLYVNNRRGGWGERFYGKTTSEKEKRRFRSRDAELGGERKGWLGGEEGGGEGGGGEGGGRVGGGEGGREGGGGRPSHGSYTATSSRLFALPLSSFFFFSSFLFLITSFWLVTRIGDDYSTSKAACAAMDDHSLHRRRTVPFGPDPPNSNSRQPPQFWSANASTVHPWFEILKTDSLPTSSVFRRASGLNRCSCASPINHHTCRRKSDRRRSSTHAADR